MSGKVARFEDFVAWQMARGLTAANYRTTASGAFAKDYGLRDQIRRAAVSVMSNIAEGFEGGRPTECQHFHSIAKASCAELRSQLYVAPDAQDLDEASFRSLQAQAEEDGRLVGGLRVSAERRRDSS